MIIVAGAPRSGTSYQMQQLAASGVPIMGEPFPENTRGLERFNPHGFWECSPLRNGINWESNPSGGKYIHPDDAMGIAVKVLGDGVARTDLSFIERVIHCIRPPGDQIESLKKLEAADGNRRVEPHWAVWARSVGSVLADAHMRRYPIEPVVFPFPKKLEYDGPYEEEMEALFAAALNNDPPDMGFMKVVRGAFAAGQAVRLLFG